MNNRIEAVEAESKALLLDGRGLMNRRAFINKLGVVAGGVALSVSWSTANIGSDAVEPVTIGRDSMADFDDPAFGTPGYAEAIPYPKPQDVVHSGALALDDPLFNIFTV